MQNEYIQRQPTPGAAQWMNGLPTPGNSPGPERPQVNNGPASQALDVPHLENGQFAVELEEPQSKLEEPFFHIAPKHDVSKIRPTTRRTKVRRFPRPSPAIVHNGLHTPPQSPDFTQTYSYAPEALYLDDQMRFISNSVLGSGAYGVVHLATDTWTDQQYAVKTLNKFGSNGLPIDPRAQQFQYNEMSLHWRVQDHPNIVSLLRIMETQEQTQVVMEYCPEGDLFTNITEYQRYVNDFPAAKDVFLQILNAVSHCHNRGVFHRDLKPENILVTNGGSQVKLADFGLATTQQYSREFGCGSGFYMSPECQGSSSSDYYACAPNDIWSLGVILVNLTCGRNPWKMATAKDPTFSSFMRDPQFLKTILPLSDELNDILGRIFEIDPQRRITLEELTFRIFHCSSFTKADELAQAQWRNQEPISPASSCSEGSMVSDSSDNSLSSSDTSYTSDTEVSVEVMDDEVRSISAEVVPVNQCLPESKVRQVYNTPVIVSTPVNSRPATPQDEHLQQPCQYRGIQQHLYWSYPQQWLQPVY